MLKWSARPDKRLTKSQPDRKLGRSIVSENWQHSRPSAARCLTASLPRTRNMRPGVALAFLAALLSGCATLETYLPRKVVACPFQYRMAQPPNPVVETNGDLEALVFLLRNFIRSQADEANRVIADCDTWVKAQR